MSLSWNASGVLAPIAPNESPTGRNRSPYSMTLTETVDFFVTTEPRLNIFRGFIQYRKALHSIGICSGFQWLNGSFVEQVEVTRKKPPKDADVVTFAYLPQDCQNQRDLYLKNPNLFDPTKIKADFQVDGYMFFLGISMTPEAVRNVSYWYSLWSHQRETSMWKGFIQLDLAPETDKSTEDILKIKEGELRYESC